MTHPNPRELAEAIAKEEEAIRVREDIEKLPQEIGAQVRWAVNGLVWTRVGDDQWKPENSLGRDALYDRTWPSSHIVSTLGEIL